MAEAEGFGLADVDALDAGGNDAAHELEKLVLALFLKLALEFGIGVEVVLDGALVAAGHEDHFGDARRSGFRHCVLDQGHVDHGEHFLGHRLRGGKKAGAETVDGEHDFANRLHCLVTNKKYN